MELLIAIGGVLISYAPNLVGFILPPFVELLNKDVKNDNERYIVAAITCLLIAVLLDWNDIAHGTPQDVLLYATLIFAESNTIYKLYFDNSRLRSVIQDKINPPIPPPSELGEGVASNQQ